MPTTEPAPEHIAQPPSLENNVASLPEATITAAADLTVFDARGNRIRFGALFEIKRTVVVFIRHFFCGSCQQYISQLSTVRSAALNQAGIRIVIIGCGDWQLINNYRDITSILPNRHISIYADPTRTLYRALGLTIMSLSPAPKNVPRKKYIVMGGFENVVRSTIRAFRNPLHFGRQGNIAQLGGEFILGPRHKCSFAHYMKNTQDHVEVAELLYEAGVAFP